MRIDQKYRKLKFAKILLAGVKSEMLASISYVKAHIEHQNKELNEEKEFWKERLDRIDEMYQKLNSYGYKNRKEYFNSIEGDPDLELLDIIEDINRSAITPEAEKNYACTLEKYDKEIEASEKVLFAIEKMAPIIADLRVTSIEEIEEAFHENDCSYLLHMPNLINISKILDEYYYQ